MFLSYSIAFVANIRTATKAMRGDSGDDWLILLPAWRHQSRPAM